MFEIYEKENYIKSIYRTTKKLMNWNDGGMPKIFLKDGQPVRRPVELATIQQNYFTSKIDKLKMAITWKDSPIQVQGHHNTRNSKINRQIRKNNLVRP